MTPVPSQRDRAMIQRIDDLQTENRLLRQQLQAQRWGAPPDVRRLADAAAAEFGVTVAEILSPGRQAHIVLPRHVVMHLAATRLHHSLSRIGGSLRRDHSSVFHGVRAIAARIAADPILAARVERVAQAALSIPTQPEIS